MIMCEVSRCLGVRSRTLQQRIESAQRPLYGHNGKRAMSSESVGCLCESYALSLPGRRVADVRTTDRAGMTLWLP